MEHTQLLNAAAMVIKHRAEIDHSASTLCVRKGKIICLPKLNLETSDIFVTDITPADLRTGVKSSRWTVIDSMLRALNHEGKIT